MATQPSLRAQFPSGPLIDETGEITPVWRAYFSQLYIRTGGAAGASSDTTQLQADLDAEEAARQAADLVLTTGLVAERTAREAADSAEAAARAQADAKLLPLAGGTMTGNIILPAATPTLPRQAVSKSYVDGAVGAGVGVDSFNTRTGAVTLSGTDITGAGGALQTELRYPNYADNSGFGVNQRTYVSGVALAAGAYAHDRWKAGAGGCTYTFTASGGPSTTITITAGTLQQVVEGLSVAGGSYMLSWTGTAQGRVGAGSYAASPVAVTGIVAGANTTLEFNAGTLGQVKLEAGTVVTPWAARTAADELGTCQRFYQGINTSARGSYSTGANFTNSVNFLVTMRATPTAVLAVSGTVGNLSSQMLTPLNPSGGYFNISTAAAGDGYAVGSVWNLSADL